MIRISITLLLVLGILILLPGSARAQLIEPPESTKIEIANLFTWLLITPIDWGRGALLAGLGLAGALITTIFLVGTTIPGTAGQVKIDSQAERLDRFYKRLDELIKADKLEPKVIGVLENMVDKMRADLRAERWCQIGIAAVLYALLGAVVASMLAQDILQALVIGAGWTGLIGNLGLKSDYKKRASEKDSALDNLQAILAGQVKAEGNVGGASEALDQAWYARKL